MVILAFSAASVGVLHTLSPGHWLPVVLMAKSRKWPLKTALLGALVAASAHIILSVILAVISVAIEAHYLSQYESEIEKYSGLALCILGLIYAGMPYFSHSGCHGHVHHGHAHKAPQKAVTQGKKTPFLFLFSVGFSPCVAVLPVVAKAAVEGSMATILTLSAFSLGVVLALIGATSFVSLGIVKLNHPIFERYGDVLAGCGVALMGIVLFFSAS